MDDVRSIYENRKYDELIDEFYYVTRDDVSYAKWSESPEIKQFAEWFEQNENFKGLYYKRTALYFTYKSKKYFVSWIHYNKRLIKMAVKKLEKLNCENININLGELD